MKTKKQKQIQIETGVKEIELSNSIIFTDFSKVKVNETNILRSALDNVGAKYKVFKKKLLRVAFQNKKLDFNPEIFDNQLGVVFSDKPIFEIAGVVYKFSKQNNEFKILGGFDTNENKFINEEDVKIIGQLPSREILLSQVVGTIAGPIRSFLYLLSKVGDKK